MITIADMLDDINLELSIEYQNRGAKPIILNDKAGALLISKAEQDIQTKLKIITTDYPLDITDSETEYLLPDDVGDIDYVRMKEDWPGAVFSFKFRAGGKYIIFTEKGMDVADFKVYYFPLINNYTEDFKRDDAVEANKPTLTLPDDAKDTIASYVVGKVLKDLMPLYRENLERLRSTLSPAFDTSSTYNIGNVISGDQDVKTTI